MKYKVGDRVRIREDLQPNVEYEGYYFVPDMGDFKGEIATVIKVCGDGYRINEDGGDWKWTDKMFEPVEFTKADLQPWDILTARNGNTFQVQENGQIKNMKISVTNFGSQDNLLNEDLTNNGKLGKDLDIIKVERPQIIWERPEKKTNEELHREMWNWLAENPDKEEGDWLCDNGYIGDKDIAGGCFACEECRQHCDECPLDKRVIGCEDGLFRVWYTTSDIRTRSRLADVIANLPWRRNDEKC